MSNPCVFDHMVIRRRTMTINAAATLAAAALLAGCGTDDSGMDPAIASVITSLENNPDIPDSWVAFARVATSAGLIQTADDVSRVGEMFAGACIDFAYNYVPGHAQISDDETRNALNEQNDMTVTAEQFDRIKPALIEMCEDM